MTVLVADTSGLVSLGIVAGATPDPVAICFDQYDCRIPAAVVTELQDIASYDDAHGTAAAAVIDYVDEDTVRSVEPEDEFPLDDGEHAAVTLANECEAGLLLCDEFNRLALVHASLATTRLVTTPTLLAVLVRTDRLTAAEASAHLDSISAARSWEGTSYVERAKPLLE